MKNVKYIIIVVAILLVIIPLSILKGLEYKKEKIKEEANIVNEIKSHYGKYVKVDENAILYNKNDEEVGKVTKDVILKLDEINIDVNTKYFYIPELESYIKYENVSPSEEYKKDDRFKNYIYFNNNIKTNDVTNFYDKYGNHLYTLNKSFDFKVLVKDTDRYGVVFNDELVYIKNDDVKEIYENINTDENGRTSIKTLLYHFLYNPAVQSCNEIICQPLSQFESHLKYLRENDYFTLKLDELEMYLDGKIQIPQKSIVLTIDDGTIFNLDAIGLLEKYECNATLFAITRWVNPAEFDSPYLDLESHTDNMHNQYECKGYGSQGGGILCLPEDKVLNDLKTSQEKLGGSKYFAYPFFDYNDRAISLLKKAGFTMAFIGQADTDGYSFPNKTDKFKVRRTTMFSSTTMDEFISYLK